MSKIETWIFYQGRVYWNIFPIFSLFIELNILWISRNSSGGWCYGVEGETTPYPCDASPLCGCWFMSQMFHFWSNFWLRFLGNLHEMAHILGPSHLCGRRGGGFWPAELWNCSYCIQFETKKVDKRLSQSLLLSQLFCLSDG